MANKKWNEVYLKKLCTRIGDGLHGTPEYVTDSEIFFINGNNIKNGKIEINSDTKKVTEFELSKNYIPLNENSLLLSINGTLGSMAFFNNEKVMLGKSTAYLNFKSSINQFYYYYFQLKGVQEYFYNVATGSTIKNLSLKSIQDFEVPIPEESEWKGIVKVLKSIDAKIELNNKINKELEAMAKLIYDYWFVQFDFPIDKSTAEKMGKPELEGKPYKASGGKMVYDKELKRDIPEGWRSGFLSDIGDIVGGSTPSKTVEEYFCNQEGTPWITPKDLSNNAGKKYITRGEYNVTEAGIKSASLKLMPKGTVLLSSRAPIGYLAISREPVTTNQGFKSFVPRSIYSSEYIYYTIQNSIKTIEANSSGSTFKEVSTLTLKTIRTILPSENILINYDNLIKPIFKKQDILEKENQKLSELRDWLLPMLMNGQVKISKKIKP
ncbi:restriction endonuclease subunit S [Jiulongibacter sediminis]|uniref:restriction endonuclease subunit S n=1 Tax=Jiulongibacter sediminis TaxID=1605367 RepID=UPI0026EC8032|nr:restriction endonuclease subunit S [Jiulongibacter sediminis]